MSLDVAESLMAEPKAFMTQTDLFVRGSGKLEVGSWKLEVGTAVFIVLPLTLIGRFYYNSDYPTILCL